MGMDTSGTKLNPITKEMFDQLAEGKVKELENLMGEKCTAPVYKEGETVLLDGVRWEVLRIEEGGLFIKPVGWEVDK